MEQKNEKRMEKGDPRSGGADTETNPEMMLLQSWLFMFSILNLMLCKEDIQSETVPAYQLFQQKNIQSV